MTEPKRFDFRISALNGVHVAQNTNGLYVYFVDYVALQQENAKLREKLESVKDTARVDEINIANRLTVTRNDGTMSHLNETGE